MNITYVYYIGLHNLALVKQWSRTFAHCEASTVCLKGQTSLVGSPRHRWYERSGSELL